MSITSFDLRDEPWITVRRLDGAVEDVSLRTAFAEAHLIREIVGDLPTQAFALLRLLLAILHRSLPVIEDPRQTWGDMWRLDTLPSQLTNAYLDEFADRFDLLHSTQPFYQVADLRTAKGEMTGLERLIADVPNGEQFFTTRAAQSVARIGYAEAARWLVHCQAFDPSGIKSGAIGDDRVKGGKGYPIGTGWAGYLGGIFAEGRDLRETLLLNLILAERESNEPLGHDDLPQWERVPLTSAVEVRRGAPTGQVDLFTWPSRRLRLDHDGDQVTGVLVCNGDTVEQQDKFLVEPMSAWRRSKPQETKLKRSPVYMPRSHLVERTMWRGLAGLLPQAPSASAGEPASSLPPGVLVWLSAVVHHLPEDFVVRTRALGIVYGSQSSVVDEIVDDAVVLHAYLLGERGRELAAAAVDAVTATDQGVTALAFLAGNLQVAAGGESDGARDRAREQAYFVLDAPFRDWLVGLDASSSRQQALYTWFDIARKVLMDLARELTDQSGPTAWVGRDVPGRPHVSTAEADRGFRYALRKALPQPEANQPPESPTPELAGV